MADKPTTSRVGRPRSRSASQMPKGTGKVGRPRSKSAQKPNVKGSSKKAATPAKRAVRPLLQFEWDTVQKNTRQFGDQLPDLLPIDLEQDNIVLDPPNQPQDLPEDNNQLQGEKPNPCPEPEELEQFNLPPNQPNQPNQVHNLLVAMVQPHQLNWSYFKPEFSGKPEEDAEEHLLRTNDWMETHNFSEDQKVRRFCLTLTGETRLWYAMLGTAQLDWQTLPDHFCQQYSKFGITREQYFHAWRSFQSDENADMIESYIHKVKQVAALLDYGEPQIIELFKIPCPVDYIIWSIT